MYYIQQKDSEYSRHGVKSIVGIDPERFTNLDMLNSLGVYPVTTSDELTIELNLFYDNTATYVINGNYAEKSYTSSIKPTDKVKPIADELLRRQFLIDVEGVSVDEIDSLNTELQSDLNAVNVATTSAAAMSVARFGPIAVDGYYPLYYSETRSNLNGDGTSHSHDLGGTTYYMPNGLETGTFYHGDYNADDSSSGSGY